MSEKLLRIKSVMDMTGKSRSSIYADIASGRFPRPVPIGARSVAWILSEIDNWIEDKISSAGI
jgi:prophage regulatory protein